MTILRTHNLTIGYNSKEGRTEVLKGLNLSLNRGEVVCLIGANGKGKSTLLRTLAGERKNKANKPYQRKISHNSHYIMMQN